METETRYCRICRIEIPKERVEAPPDTLVCVKCSEKMGGENEVIITVVATGKPGSLKKTGQEVMVKVKPRELKWVQRIPRQK